MTEKNVLDVPELGTSNAFEILDTKSYDAEFSNDISQFQWDDKYHHEDYQTTGSLKATAAALNGKDIGIIKTGLGRLILSGSNSYEGATIVEGGELMLAKRADGSGGELENSTAIVRTEGTLSGNGLISTSLINNGVVTPGLFGLTDLSASDSYTLTANDYIQGSDGTLRIFFDEDGNHGVLHSTTSLTLDGGLLFSPVSTFYAKDSTYNLTVLTGSAPSGNFASTDIELASPTLDLTLNSINDAQHTITIARPTDAYAQFGKNKGARSLGYALTNIVPSAQGDMQNLLTALDFSSPDGRDVTRALSMLGPESYDILSQASFTQQRSFNRFVVKRMFEKNSTTEKTKSSASQALAQDAEQSSLSGGSSHSFAQPTYHAWGQVLGSTTYQGEYDNISGYDSTSVGLVAGIDYAWTSGLTAGIHVAFSVRDTNFHDALDAKNETEGASLGVQALFAPKEWEGAYLMAQGRLGFEQNTMYRTVTIDDYSRTSRGYWVDFVGSALVGGGKDWQVDNFRIGPVLWLEYSFIQRPQINESNGMATRLEMDAAYYDSLRSSLGVHVGYAVDISESLNLDFDVLATWQHELLEGSMTTKAAFVDYGNMGFSSSTPLIGRNSFNIQTSLRISHVEDYFAQLDVGGELTDGHGQSLYLGLKVGYSF